MKLSYKNISILADLFEGVKIYKNTDNQIWLIKASDRVRMVVDYFEINGRSKVEGGKFGGFSFDDTTTVNDFKALCAHLGVELVEKVDFNYAMGQERKAYIEDMEIEARDRESFFK